MSRRRALAWLPLGIGCLGMFVAGAAAQSSGMGPGLSISGYVRDDVNHQPLKGVTLELMGTSGTTASPAVMSGINGEFRFSGLGSGDYRIFGHQKGFCSI